MSFTKPTICLKIDVDTLQGYLEGIPCLLDVFDRVGVRATFCVAMGPDTSGRAIRRIFTQRGFLAKMLRTRAGSAYGIRTMLYGTLLPAPSIVERKPELLREIAARGHEVIPHGWDHIAWHDYLIHWDKARAGKQLKLACDMYTRKLQQPCHAFAAPGWQASAVSLQLEESMGMVYSADTRGWTPFFPLVDGRPLGLVQLPTTLPTLDELIGRKDLAGMDLTSYVLGRLHRPPAPPHPEALEEHFAAPHLHIYTGHTEMEGHQWAEWFERLLASLVAEHFDFVTLNDIARTLITEGQLPVMTFSQGRLPGRAGTVTCQQGLV